VSVSNPKTSQSISGIPMIKSESNLRSKRYIRQSLNQNDYTPDLHTSKKNTLKLYQSDLRPRVSRRNTEGKLSTLKTGNINKSVDLSNYRRNLPIIEKDKVFDEWAAIMKHQDEIDVEIRRLHKQKLRERQIKYKQDLDSQHHEFLARKEGALTQEMAKEEKIRKIQIKKQLEKSNLSESMKKRKLDNLKSDAMHSIFEQREKTRIEKDIRLYEVEKQHKLANDESRMHSSNIRSAKMAKLDNESEYYKFLSHQLLEKQNRLNNEKEADKKFAQTEKVKLDQQHDERNRYFDKLEGFQKANDQKNLMFKKYMAGEQTFIDSRKDEAAYIKHLELENQKAEKESQLEIKKRIKMKNENFYLLDEQMREKERKQMAVKKNQELISQKLANEMNNMKIDQIEKEKRNNDRKKKYSKDLQDQIIRNNKKKTYSSLMTDHERRVNEGDLIAYQQEDNKNLYSLVPGFDSYNKQEDYIDKSMKLENQDKVRVGLNNKSNFHESFKNNEMSLKSKRNRNPSPLENPVTNRNGRHSNESNYHPHKLELVRKNMEMADRDNYRASTINKSYGTVNM
jgi:hypothetical protein